MFPFYRRENWSPNRLCNLPLCHIASEWLYLDLNTSLLNCNVWVHTLYCVFHFSHGSQIKIFLFFLFPLTICGVMWEVEKNGLLCILQWLKGLSVSEILNLITFMYQSWFFNENWRHDERLISLHKTTHFTILRYLENQTNDTAWNSCNYK